METGIVLIQTTASFLPGIAVNNFPDMAIARIILWFSRKKKRKEKKRSY